MSELLSAGVESENLCVNVSTDQAERCDMGPLAGGGAWTPTGALEVRRGSRAGTKMSTAEPLRSL